MTDHDYGTSPASMGRTIRTIRVSEVRAPMLEAWGKRFMELEDEVANLKPSIATNAQIMALMALASKSALLAEDLEKFSPDNPVFPEYMERVQFIQAAKDARPILAEMDEKFPGLVAVPHDGVQWKDRG